MSYSDCADRDCRNNFSLFSLFSLFCARLLNLDAEGAVLKTSLPVSAMVTQHDQSTMVAALSV